jgi:ABC-2 type transport system permease protein
LFAIGLAVLFGFCLSWLWTTLALILRTPASVRTAVQGNPISHLIDADRGLMQGHAPTSQILWMLIASAVLLTVFAPATARLYRKG